MGPHRDQLICHVTVPSGAPWVMVGAGIGRENTVIIDTQHVPVSLQHLWHINEPEGAH